MQYEECLIDGVLNWRSAPTEKWQPMTPERLTALVLELRQRQTAPSLQPYYVPVAPTPIYPYPNLPWTSPWCTVGDTLQAAVDHSALPYRN